MENTIKNKSKFFAQYWGQKVLVFNDQGQYVKGGRYEVDGSVDNHSFLELKPLSSISDEDAIKVFDKVFPNSLPTNDYDKIETIKEVYENEFRVYRFLGLDDSTSFIDACRALEYALPFNGLSIKKQIEYNWVKIKK